MENVFCAVFMQMRRKKCEKVSEFIITFFMKKLDYHCSDQSKGELFTLFLILSVFVCVMLKVAHFALSFRWFTLFLDDEDS